MRVYILLLRAFATLADSTISMTRWLRSWQRSSSNLCNSKKKVSPWLAGLFVGLEQSRVELCQDSVITKKSSKKGFLIEKSLH